MLVLRRREGQWVEITHRSGDRVRVRVCRLSGEGQGRADLVFDDSSRNFQIDRPERALKATEAGDQPCGG